MRNENIIEAIESQLADAIELGMTTEEALADTAGLLSEAEARFLRLSHPGISLPPPPRSRA
jgi:tryptophan synthase alpha subunit